MSKAAPRAMLTGKAVAHASPTPSTAKLMPREASRNMNSRIPPVSVYIESFWSCQVRSMSLYWPTAVPRSWFALWLGSRVRISSWALDLYQASCSCV